MRFKYFVYIHMVDGLEEIRTNNPQHAYREYGRAVPGMCGVLKAKLKCLGGPVLTKAVA